MGDQTIRYEYDSQNRLTHYFDPITNRTRVYIYDDRGNILEVKYAEYMTEEEYAAFKAEYGDSALPGTVYTYSDSTWADLMTAYGGQAISYDELGNPLNWIGRNITLTWENGRRLKQYKQASINQYDYTYNADGLRTSKTITTRGTVTKSTEYYIVNGQYIGEVTNIGGTEYVIAYVYDENGAPAGINVNGSAYFFAKNLQGDIVAILDYTGTVVAKYTYDVWGNLISVTDKNGDAITDSTKAALLNPFRYRGYMYDEETRFYYVSSRYYDPSVGRWLNADGQISGVGGDIQGYNQFAYCFNNPVNMSDPSGEWPFFVVTAAIGAVIGAVAGGVVAAKSGKNVWAGIGIGAAAGALIGTGAGMAAGAALAGSITATTAQVAFGASALATTVATGGVGAGAAYVANNLQQAGNNLTSTITSANDPVKNALKQLDSSGLRPGQTEISRSKVMEIVNNFNPIKAESRISTINGTRFVVDGHHTTVASTILNKGTCMNMGIPTNQLPSATNIYWSKHWYEFWKTTIKIID